MFYYLLKFNKDWADEFDVDGFKVVNEQVYKNMVAEYSGSETPFEYSFGTNEGWEDDETEGDIWEEIQAVKITESEAMVLHTLFGRTYGVFPF